MSYNCQKRSKTMSQSKFYKVVVSLVLLLVMVNAGGGGQLAHANPGDVICSYAAALETVSIGDDGTIYSVNSSGVLYAINPNCTLKWQYQTSGAYNTSPVIADDGTIYFLGKDSFYAVNPDGTLKWQQQTVKAAEVWQNFPAIGGDGTIYIGDSQRVLYALNPLNGSIRWQYPTGAGILTKLLPVIGSDGTIYFGTADKGLFAINSDGTLKWQYSSIPEIKATPAVGNDGIIYAGGYNSDRTVATFFALTPSGTLKWRYDIQGVQNFFGIPVSIGSDGTIYYGKFRLSSSNLYKLYAMNSDGNLKWTTDITQNTALYPSIAIGADGTVYSQNSGNNNNFQAINSVDGTMRWQANVGGIGTNTTSAPAIAPDGIIYVGLSSGLTTGLYAVQGDAPWTYTDYLNSMKGYADSPWPRFKQNNFNTGHRPKMPAGVSLPDVQSCNQTVSIPITLNNSAKVGIEGIDLTVTFDSSVITPQNPPATLTGGIYQSGYGLNYNKDVSGQIRLSIYATGTPSTVSGIIAYLNFNVVGAVGSTTKLSFTQSLVNSVTSNRTDGSFTVIGCTISGKVVYHSPSATPIPNAQIILDGTPVAPPAGYTDANGNYTITASPGTHKVSVSKITDLGGVSGTDASDISRYAAGRTDVSFNCYQKIAADVNRDGQIDSVDASRVARYSVGLIPCMNSSIPCIDWVFTPYPITSCTNWPPITYPTERTVTIPPSATGQDFIGIRLGYVTGDWLPGMSTRSLRDNIELRENSATCNQTASGSTLKIPVVLSQSSAIKGIDIVAEFDSSVLTATDVTLTGGILDGKGYTVAFNTGIAGKISATIYAAGDVDLFTGSGEVGYISFTVSKSQSTAISLTKFNCNKTAAYGGLKIDGLVCQIPIPVVLPSCDPDFDGKFTMSDAIYYLQCIAGVRQDCICNENLGSVIQVLRIVSGL